MCLIDRSRIFPVFLMPRGRTWQFDEELSHAAWVRVLRGHRPPSVQWPKASQQQGRQTGLQRSGGQWQRQPRPPQNVTRQDQGQNFKPPEEYAAAARARIPQLEAALTALGNSTGPEVVALQQALKKARIDAEGMPLATQLKECQLFVERKEKKIASIDQERFTILSELLQHTGDQLMMVNEKISENFTHDSKGM